MKGADFISNAQNTWCPGCGNFSIQRTLKRMYLPYLDHSP